MEESIVCKFKNYLVEGEVAILDWYDILGTIGMHNFEVGEDFDFEDKKRIIHLLNDGGFGAKDILAAQLSIFKVYEHGAKVFWKHLCLNAKEPEKKIPEKIKKAFYFEFEE